MPPQTAQPPSRAGRKTSRAKLADEQAGGLHQSAIAAAAAQLGVSQDVALAMELRCLLFEARRRHASTRARYVRLEPTLTGLDGWEAVRAHIIEVWPDSPARSWLLDPVGPFFYHDEDVGYLVEAAPPGSAAHTALTAALWEAQDD